jgi:hypothetical protein
LDKSHNIGYVGKLENHDDSMVSACIARHPPAFLGTRARGTFTTGF